jgi:hypothetical protein
MDDKKMEGKSMTETEITLKNTKAEILEALNSALQRSEAAEQGKLNPEKTEKERTEKKAIESAKKAVEQNIFSKELNDKFNDLQVAIAAEEGRLQDLYGVGRELQRLALVIESGKECLVAIEVEKLAKTEEVKNSLERLKAEFAQKNTELQAEYALGTKKLALDRTREGEEYQYNLTRAHEKENNAWADEKAAREAALLKREEQAAALLAEAESKVEYVKSLEAKVDGISALLESEKKIAADTATAALQREFEYKSTLADKDHENSVARLADKISYLEKELDMASKSVNTLQSKLDKAYGELRELATKTVESASGVKIIGNTENKG